MQHENRHPLDWLALAACGTTDGSVNPLFDIQEDRGQSLEVKAQIRRQTASAKAICNGLPVVTRGEDGEAVVKWGTRPCPIRDRCLELALRLEGNADHKDRAMIFGGHTPKERARLAKERAMAEAPDLEAPPAVEGCVYPGSQRGVGRHMLRGEPMCKRCEPFELSESDLDLVEKLVRDGKGNSEIFRRTTIHSDSIIRTIRVALGIPDKDRTRTRNRALPSVGGEAPLGRDYVDPVKVERWINGDRKILLTKAERLEMFRRVHALGITTKEIGRRYYTSDRQALRDQAELGLVGNGTHPGLPLEERRARVAELHAAGRPDDHIAKALGVENSTVARDRKALGLPVLYGPGGRPVRSEGEAA